MFIGVHSLTAVDTHVKDLTSTSFTVVYSYVKCRRCGEEFASVMAASRVSCPGPKES